MTDRRLIARLFKNDEKLVSARYQTVNGDELAPGDEISADLDRGLRMKLWLSRRAVYEADFRPTPVADEQPAADPAQDQDWQVLAHGVEAIPGDAENFFIKAEWLDETETVRGEEAAKARVEELRAEAIAKSAAAPVLDDDGNPIDPPQGDANDPAAEIDGADPAQDQDSENAGDQDQASEASGALVSVEETGGGWYAIKAPWLAEPIKVRGEEAANKRAAEIAAEGAPPPAE
jgi:hypothetical protein